MKVFELITKLFEYPAGAEVYIDSDEIANTCPAVESVSDYDEPNHMKRVFLRDNYDEESDE